LQQLIFNYNIQDQKSQIPQVQDYNIQPLQISQVMNLESQNLPINIPFNNSNKEKILMSIFKMLTFILTKFYL